MSHDAAAPATSARPSYPRSGANTPRRGRDRASWDADVVHGILDATPVCHLSYDPGDDVGPITVPTSFARDGEAILFHSSSGAHVAHLARARGGRIAVCLSVTLVDGWVLARSGMHHSMNYRAVVVRGQAVVVAGEADRRAALDAILDAVWTGRSRHCRPPDAKELAATTVFRLPLETVSAKVRATGVDDDPRDLDGPHWAGVVPVRSVVDEPIPSPDLPADIELVGHTTGSAFDDPRAVSG
ncbi:pyridoxamine 5'-phosphate oxidase family protein [Salsipaludibacter albus]|uniref:pyridoxamine 5'-phosphate oxidase family protein n=1 Tax=Salsipaludibacter albus TaxID=2849650 RepID=UPI001EE40AA5|nr:pyridoxamine 5'-phosphate oxidase family protein [Salsipaludibacter albus]